MSESVKSGVRPAVLLGGAMALAGLMSLPLAAQAADESSPIQLAQPDAQVVVRDADGRLRAPTGAELDELKKSAPSAKSRSFVRARTIQAYDHHRTGARGVRLTEEFMTYSVVVKQPDGRLTELEVQGRDAADAAAKAGTAQPRNILPTE